MNGLNELRDRAKSMAPLFYPSSIAVIGASEKPTKPGEIVLTYLLEGGFRGNIFPVNPREKEIKGLRCYPSVLDIPEQVDLVVIVVTAPLVMKIFQECAAKGIKGAIIFSSGFAEVGEEGIKLQEELKELAGRHKIKICGPNCMGIANYRNNMRAVFSFASIFPVNPPQSPQNICFLTQSGGFGLSVTVTAAAQGLGFSYFVSTGNEAESDFSDFLAFSADDPQTSIIAGYMEGIRDGRKLALAADMAREAKKPVVIFKTGRYKASAKAALSHTGALTGSDMVYSSFFRQKGIIRPESIEELIAILTLLETKMIPRGKRAVIFASSGGHGVVMADKFAEAGLEVAVLAEDTCRKISGLLPSFASVTNPIDFTGMDMVSRKILKACAEVVAEDPGVDMLIFSYWAANTMESHVWDQMVQIKEATSKPVIAIIMASMTGAALEHMAYLKRHGIPVVAGIDFAVKAISKVVDYTFKINSGKQETSGPAGSPARERVEGILAGHSPGARLSEAQAKGILAAYGIPVTRERRAGSAGEALEAAGQIGYPVALKIDSPDILHKTEAGGIKLNLTSAGQVEESFEEILASAGQYQPGANIAGVLVQEMLKEGTEVMVGIGNDPVFGSTVMFGLGGIFVEQLGDVSLRVAPVGENDAWEMLREIKAHRVLDGVRGRPPVDKRAVVDIILKLSQLAMDFPQIAELDINPLIVFEEGKGACAADALIILKGAVSG